ncbi:MAG: hypothetical protein LLG42_07905 [Chloroflexi bacterium]|nr:hypothetical protein [Chloroflexota bacterium]
MPKTQTKCPRCRQPVIADIEQLFDMNTDPRAKQKLLSGTANIIHCPNCGYEGNVSTPIVYHDPDKEFLFTFFPPDMGIPVNEQEKMIGPLIKRVLDKLPNEKRKGYLFKPQTMFTFQTMIEKILEGDGITKEMLDAQQRKARLLERLVLADENARLEIIKENESDVDEELFQLLSRLIQITMSQGDQQGAKKLADVQKTLVENTTTGKEIEEKTREIDAAIKSLQEASKEGLTREKLLDLITTAPTETRLAMLVSLARQGLDYTFFELLTTRINESSGEEQQRLSGIREKVLNMTHEIDQSIQAEMERARKLLSEILNAADIEGELHNRLDQVTDYFIEVVRSEMELAERTNDLSRMEKLQKVARVIEEESAPPEIQLIEEMLSVDGDAALQNFIDQHADEITPEFVQMLNNVTMQSEQQGQAKELVDRLKQIYRIVLKHSMRMNMKN